MCTAITFQAASTYFGRNLDNDISYNESVTITPREFPFRFHYKESIPKHFALIGMATVDNNYPLYYDATNEAGLSMAGLNFPGNAHYNKPSDLTDNIAPYELIPWILGQCESTTEALSKIKTINITATPFSNDYPLTPLHWLVADKSTAYTIEQTIHGLNIHENPIGVLTNNPPFQFHMYNLINYLNLTAAEPTNRLTNLLHLQPYSRGMGAIGLPGDLSSSSRFIKATFTKLNSVHPSSENDSISQFFHILSSVAQQEGCVQTKNGLEKTLYSSCCDVEKCVYYYTTYSNSQITGVSLHKENINGSQLISYPLFTKQQIRMEN